ncbi:neutral zinc metallopeptidase [Kribbella aluminosa]|uniref:neutral zinc metallopeptidase n=1 Tax=Kribbella aluminosa TaxID=416017 RepID=UPI0031D2F18F
MSLEDTYLLHNQLYTAGQVPATPCYLPGGPLKTRSDVQRSANAMLVCLQSAWKPVVEHADASFAPTTLYVVTVGARTACGGFDADSDAFYCTDNSDIYLDWTQHLEESPDDRQYASADLLWVMAHEFGHHLQQLAGISAYYDDRLDRTTGAASLEQTRRLELQASCLAAAFLGANRDTLDLYDDRIDAYQDEAYSGDEDAPSSPRDHGSRKSSTAWSKAAFTAKSPSACNTWSAPANRVS